jgi:hypothetical protein
MLNPCSEIALTPEQYEDVTNWSRLPQCVIDAVFSCEQMFDPELEFDLKPPKKYRSLDDDWES